MAEHKRYETPSLTRLPFVSYDKHTAHGIVAAADLDEDYDAAALVAAHGSPLYVVSEQRLRRDFRAFRDAFTDTGFDTEIAYSVKTNYLPAIVSILKEEGAWAEVVSGMEYDLARSLGYPANRIIFNGPHKTDEELNRALGEGALVNIDGFDELARIEAIAATLPAPARVGLRISFRHGSMGWTKFGFDDETGDSHKALTRIAGNARLNLELLHCHVGTFVLIEELYAKATERLIALAKRARQLGLRPNMIDLGGGFPSSNTLRPEYDLPGGSQRSGDFWFPYADAIGRRLQKAAGAFEKRPTLMLEPGRAVVDACAHLLCTVVACKVVDGRQRAVIVDAGVNLAPTVCYYNHPLSRSAAAEISRTGQHHSVDIYGPLCMQSDRLREQAHLPPLAIGDILAISHVGAYCHSQSMQFIQTRPATVLLGPDGPDVIRRRETWRDVFALDHLPERLRDDAASF